MICIIVTSVEPCIYNCMEIYTVKTLGVEARVQFTPALILPLKRRVWSRIYTFYGAKFAPHS